MLTLALMGELLRTLFRFFEDSEKTAGLRAAVFRVSYQPSFPHIYWKFCPQVNSGQFMRSGQLTIPPKKFVMLQ